MTQPIILLPPHPPKPSRALAKQPPTPPETVPRLAHQFPGADPVAQLNAAIQAVPDDGGVVDATLMGSITGEGMIQVNRPVRLILGFGTVQTTGPAIIEVTSPWPVIIEGQYSWNTQLVTTHPTQHGIHLATPIGCRLQDLMVKTAVKKTGGAGVLVDGGSPGQPNAWSHASRVWIVDQWVAFDAADAALWWLHDSYLVNSRHTSLHIACPSVPDAGDSSLRGCTLHTADPGSVAIHHESSGGLRMHDTKVLQHDLGYWFDLAPGVSTSIFVMTGSSFEHQREHAVLFTRQEGSDGRFSHVNISGPNQFTGSALDDKSVICIDGAGWLQNLTCVGNTFHLGAHGTAVEILGARAGVIGLNMISGNGGARSRGVYLGRRAEKIILAPNAIDGVACEVVDDRGMDEG